MAAFTSKATGNWSSAGQTTWNEVGVPGNGDTVTINNTHTVTVDTNTTVGTSPVAGTVVVTVTGTTGTLVIATGVTLTVRGDINLNNSVLTMNAGSTLTFDASAATPTSTTYRILNGTAGYQHTAKVAINGSSGSRCTVNSNASGGNGYITNTADSGSLVVTYCDFTRVGDATNPAVRANAQQDAGIDLQNCTFTSCGKITQTGSPGATIVFRFRGVTTTSTAGTTSLDIDTGTTTMTSGTRLVQDCAFDKITTISRTLNLTCTNNILTDPGFTNDNAVAWASFTGNLLRFTTGAVNIYGDITNCYVLHLQTSGNPHMLGMGSDNRNQTISGCIFELIDSAVDGDCILAAATSNNYTLTVSHNLKLPNTGNNSPGTLVSALGNAKTTLVMTHNTVHSGGTGGENISLRVGETYNAHAGMVTSVQNNLGWDGTAGRGYLAGNINGAPNTDVVTSANMDYNGKYNLIGTGYTGWVFSSGSPGAHDVTGDPQFVDSARDIAKWDTSLGGAGTAANAVTELSKLNDAAGYNTNYTIAALMTYVKAGFVPQNVAFRAANDSVAPSNGWMGALQGTGTIPGLGVQEIGWMATTWR
jgi:hypothetical protein